MICQLLAQRVFHKVVVRFTAVWRVDHDLNARGGREERGRVLQHGPQRLPGTEELHRALEGCEIARMGRLAGQPAGNIRKMLHGDQRPEGLKVAIEHIRVHVGQRSSPDIACGKDVRIAEGVRPQHTGRSNQGDQELEVRQSGGKRRRIVRSGPRGRNDRGELRQPVEENLPGRELRFKRWQNAQFLARTAGSCEKIEPDA